MQYALTALAAALHGRHRDAQQPHRATLLPRRLLAAAVRRHRAILSMLGGLPEGALDLGWRRLLLPCVRRLLRPTVGGVQFRLRHHSGRRQALATSAAGRIPVPLRLRMQGSCLSGLVLSNK